MSILKVTTVYVHSSTIQPNIFMGEKFRAKSEYLCIPETFLWNLFLPTW